MRCWDEVDADAIVVGYPPGHVPAPVRLQWEDTVVLSWMPGRYRVVAKQVSPEGAITFVLRPQPVRRREPTMSECAVAGCQERQLHEHRQCRWTIQDDVFWYQLRDYEIRQLNEARSALHLPVLIFAQTPLPSPEAPVADTPE